MTPERFDVMVVGLGPAGACAATAAARGGASVLAVDRKHVVGQPVQCAELVPALIGSHADDVVHALRQPITSMRTFVEDDPPDLTTPFPGHMLDRAAFDAGLVYAAEHAGAACEFQTAVRSIGPDGTLVLSDGRAIRARVLIGADGPRSLVGRAIGIVNRELVETRQITVPLVRPHAATDIYLSADIPGGYGWMFPKRELANLGVGVDPQHKVRLKAILDRLHAVLVRAGQLGADVLGLTGGAIPVGGMLEPCGHLASTQVLLAGDACGLTNAVTGAGIASAVQSGHLAGQAAAALVAGDAAAVEGYRDELVSVFGPALERAVERRRELAVSLAEGRSPRNAALRRGWIAYPQYWATHQSLQSEEVTT